jgi:predicted nucleic acid-binding protein
MIQVADASAVVAALIDDSDDGRWCEVQLSEGGLHAPHLMPFEAANIVRRTVARGDLDQSEGAAALRDLGRLDVELIPFEPLAARAWALRTNLTVYDASYVALAEALTCRVVTLDTRLSKATGPRCEIVSPPSRTRG